MVNKSEENSPYNKLKYAIINSVQIQQLPQLKISFEQIVKSPRRLSKVESTLELLDLLERRGLLSKYNTNYLDHFINIVDNPGLNTVIDAYRRNIATHPEMNGVNVYAKIRLERKSLQEEEEIKAKLKAAAIEGNHDTSNKRSRELLPRNTLNSSYFDGDIKLKIYDLIATEMGRNFREFGRNLELREAELDEIELAHIKYKNRTFALFPIFEDRVDKRKIVMKLLDALQNSRRNDIRKKVENMLSR